MLLGGMGLELSEQLRPGAGWRAVAAQRLGAVCAFSFRHVFAASMVFFSLYTLSFFVCRASCLRHL